MLPHVFSVGILKVGDVAQRGARDVRNVKARGSIPLIPSIRPYNRVFENFGDGIGYLLQVILVNYYYFSVSKKHENAYISAIPHNVQSPRAEIID
jgi:hypothetical protein